MTQAVRLFGAFHFHASWVEPSTTTACIEVGRPGSTDPRDAMDCEGATSVSLGGPQDHLSLFTLGAVFTLSPAVGLGLAVATYGADDTQSRLFNPGTMGVVTVEVSVDRVVARHALHVEPAPPSPLGSGF